jgi:hypothetical protein
VKTNQDFQVCDAQGQRKRNFFLDMRFNET